MVSHLSLQIKTHRNLRRQNEALDQLRVMMLDNLESKQRAALVFFVARSLEYLAGAESHIKPVATIIVDYAVDCAMDGNTAAWQDVAQCAQSCVERREFVRSIIVRQLASEFRREDLSRSSAIHDAISYFDLNQRLAFPERQRLPADLSSIVRDELKSFVIERVRHSAFHAAAAWEWYGVLDKSLIAKHGVATYFNTTLGDFDDLDGLSVIALAAAESIHVRLPVYINRRKASDALAWIGMAGFFSVPLPKEQFRVVRGGGFGLALWEQLFRHETVSAEVAAGLLFAMMVATELQNRMEEEEGRFRKQKPSVRRKDLIDWLLANKGLPNLGMFPQIRAAAEAKSLFI